eukprot:TRINITY_DN11668_c0_g1_i3.p1 TRINITY_DN11668_c0_g1~~TRINITY_DN11668_c0_g1_i3.p1  ORF type:complete len:356 (+),score=129.76 TRINITY_DN11668_c0_g1_i3:152-1219(+)
MAEQFHGLVSEIRTGGEAELYDLSGYNQAQVNDLMSQAFSTPIPASGAMRCSFTIGGGKNSRQKYPEDLPKYVSTALRGGGYTEDRGASCCLQCQGSFKYQHDTDKNVKTMHVFPHVSLPEEGSAGEDEGLFWTPDSLSPEYMCTVSSFNTFKMMTAAKVPTFTQKKTLSKQLKEMVKRLQGFEERMCAMDVLSAAEQELYDSADMEAMADKLAWLEEQMDLMLANGHVSHEEMSTVRSTVSRNLDRATAELAQAEGSDKKAKRIAKQIQHLQARLAMVNGADPQGPVVSGEERARREGLKALFVRLLALEKIEGSKTLLDASQVQKLQAKPRVEQEIEETMAACRTWFLSLIHI